jgi:hypothetical protein
MTGRSANAACADRDRMREAAIWGGLLWALGFFWIFRKWLFGNFDGIFGDDGDARILIMLLEHWHRVFTGRESDWLNPPFFYPERHVLGFTDAYFLYGVAYSILRAGSADPFAAFMLLMAVLSVVGFFGFMRLAMADFAVSPPSAAVGAFLFAFPNMMGVKMGHAQSYCAMLLPIIAHLAATASKTRRRPRAIGMAAAAGLLHALIFSTAYLTGWFATTFALLAALIYFILCGGGRAREVLQYALSVKRHVLVAYLAGFTVGIVPFLVVYLPIWLQGRGRTLDEVITYAPSASDIINVGPGNVIWGRILQWLGIVGGHGRPLGELELGYTPGVFGVCLLMTIVSLRSWLRQSGKADGVTVAALALGASLFGFWLVQLDYFGFMPWALIWATAPGASGVRTTFRSQIVLNLAAALLVAIALDRIRSWPRRPLTKRSFAAILIATLLVLEQTNRHEPKIFSRSSQWAWLARVPPPPSHCRAFFVVPGPAPPGTAWFVHQVDAMLVATLFGVPTVNGSTSVFPNDWRLFDPSGPDYAGAVRDWLSLKGLSRGMCGLDPRSGRWTEGPP